MGMKRHSSSTATKAEESDINSRRNRVISAYTKIMETLEEDPEAKDEAGNLLDYEELDGDPLCADRDRWYNTGCCGCIVYCLRYCWSVDESTLPYKLLYIFTRGGYAAITTFLVVYFTQVGISPGRLGQMQLLPHLATAIVAPTVGFLADVVFGNVAMLLVALVLLSVITLSIMLVPPPHFADCTTALQQLHDSIKVAGNQDYIPSTCSNGPINRTFEGNHHWGSILRLPITNWSDVLESCYPEGHFKSHMKPELTASRHLSSYGVSFMSSQQTEMAIGWMYDSINLENSFFTVFLLVSAGTLVQQVILSLIDGVTLRKLGRERRHEYGLQRSTGTAGFAVCAMAVAYIVKITEAYRYICLIPVTVQDYYVGMIFLLVGSCCSIAIVIGMCLSRCKEHSETAAFNVRDVFVIFRRGSFVPIVITALFLSICEGLVQPFLIWHIQYIGGTTETIAWSTVTMGVTELLMAFSTGKLILHFGYSPLLCVGVGVYFIRFLVYALISNTATVFAAEILHGISIALTWNVIVAYLSGAVPQECQSFLMGILRGLCFGLGEGFGILIAGYFIDVQGTFNTFYLYSLFCLTGCFVLVIYQTSRAALPITNGDAHQPFQPIDNQRRLAAAIGP